MALRYRTRLSVAVGVLIALAISGMSVLIMVSAMMGIAGSYHKYGIILTTVATRSISDSVELSRNLTELLNQPEANLEAQRLKALAATFSIQDTIDQFVLDSQVDKAVVVDLSGNVLAARSVEGEKDSTVDSTIVKFCMELLRQPEESYLLRGFGGGIGVVTRLGDANNKAFGVLFIQHDTGHLVSFARHIVIEIGLLGVVITSIAIWISSFLSKDFARPIDILAQGVREFGQGNLDHRVRIHTRDELHDLAEAFNTMAQSLQESMARLADETKRRERLESELSIAAELQRSLLPDAPPGLPGLDVYGWSMAAKEVGGDFYDFIDMGRGRLGIAIGDATGKGLPAALLISECWSALRALASETDSPSDLLFRTNNALCRRVGRTGRFVTLFFMIIDTHRCTIRYAMAGHNPPILVGAHPDRVQHLGSKVGLPLGLQENCRFEETDVALEPHDTILLYSDGLVDAHDPNNCLYGSDRVSDLLVSLRTSSIEEVVDQMREDVHRHMQGRELFDDMTMVGVRFIAAERAVA